MAKPTLQELMKQRILILDGAMGTMIQQENLTAADFGGEELDGCNEILVLTRPDVIGRIHEAYLEAGADILETNTFGATSVVLMEYDIPEKAREINLAAAAIARQAADKYSTPDKPRYVAGALGPTTKNQILSAFDAEIHDLAERRGYRTWDIIALSDATPNLDELLKKFEQVHTHTEDEVRAITAGRGIFIIKGTDDIGYFNVELEAGDVISVPEHKPHFFTLMDNRQIVAVRLFIETEGWIAHPFADPAFQQE